MKQTFITMSIIIATTCTLMACSDDSKENDNIGTTEVNQNVSEQDNRGGDNFNDNKEDKSDSAPGSKKSDPTDSDKASSKENENKESNAPSNNEAINTLSEFSSEEIEYARVWLQVGENQDINELNVKHIPAGEPLNPNDETSDTYPEDVIQLAGSRLIDGSVTYSSNGDGTINKYNVPLRWDGNYPAGKDFYTEIIENTEVVEINPGDDKEVIELIKLLDIDTVV